MCGCCGGAFSNLFEIISQEKETPHQVTYDRGHFHFSKQIDKTKIVSICNIYVKYYPFSSWYEFMLMRMIWYEINALLTNSIMYSNCFKLQKMHNINIAFSI